MTHHNPPTQRTDQPATDLLMALFSKNRAVTSDARYQATLEFVELLNDRARWDGRFDMWLKARTAELVREPLALEAPEVAA